MGLFKDAVDRLWDSLVNEVTKPITSGIDKELELLKEKNQNIEKILRKKISETEDEERKEELMDMLSQREALEEEKSKELNENLDTVKEGIKESIEGVIDEADSYCSEIESYITILAADNIKLTTQLVSIATVAANPMTLTAAPPLLQTFVYDLKETKQQYDSANNVLKRLKATVNPIITLAKPLSGVGSSISTALTGVTDALETGLVAAGGFISTLDAMEEKLSSGISSKQKVVYTKNYNLYDSKVQSGEELSDEELAKYDEALQWGKENGKNWIDHRS